MHFYDWYLSEATKLELCNGSIITEQIVQFLKISQKYDGKSEQIQVKSRLSEKIRHDCAQ